MRKYLHRRREVVLDSILITILAIVPFSRVGITGLIEFIDFPFHPDLPDFFFKRLTTWQTFSPIYGWDSSLELAQIPYWIFPTFLAFIGVPVSIIERIWWIIIYSLYGLSMYYLVYTLFGPKRRIAALISAIFYMYNPYHAAYFIVPGGIYSWNLVFAVAPIILALYIQGLNKKNLILRNAILIGLISITQVVGNIELTLLATYPLIFYLLFYILVNHSKEKCIHALKFTALVAIFSLVTNLWWILPTLNGYGELYAQQTIYLEALENIDKLREKVGSPSMLDPLRTYQTYDPFGFGSYYNSPIGLILSIIIPILVFSALILKPKDRLVLFFTLSSALYIAGVRGGKPPFGEFYIWGILHTLPYGLGPLFPIDVQRLQLFQLEVYAPLLGITSYEMYYRLSKHKFNGFRKSFRNCLGKILVLLIFSLILINSWPLLTGNGYGFYVPINIPKYYYAAKKWLQEQPEDFKIYLLPAGHRVFHLKFTWSPKSELGDFSTAFFPKPAILNVIDNPRIIFDVPRVIESSIYQNKTRYIGKILGLMNVKYLLLREDVDPFFRRISPLDFVYLKKVLQQQDGLSLVRSFGKLHFYENHFFTPRIFASTYGIAVIGGTRALIPMTYLEGLQMNNKPFFFLEQYKDKEKVLTLSKYLVVVRNPPIRLPLNGDFEKDWSKSWKKYGTADADLETNIVFSGYSSIRIRTQKDPGWLYQLMNSLDTRGLWLVWSQYRTSGEAAVMLRFSDNSWLAYTSHPGWETDNWKRIVLPSPSNKWITFVRNVGEDVARIYGEYKSIKEIALSPGINCEGYFDNIYFIRQDQLAYVAENLKDQSLIRHLKDVFMVYLLTGNSTQVIYVPKDGFYEFATRTLSKNEQTKFRLFIDGITVNVTTSDLVWHYFQPMYLKEGYHILSLKGFKPDSLSILYELSDNNHIDLFNYFKSNSTVKLTFKKLHQTEYKVYVDAKKPFILVLSEVFHSKWNANIGDNKQQHFLANSFANAFYITKQGEYEFHIIFDSQKFFHLGFYITVLFWVSFASVRSIKRIFKRSKDLRRK